MPKTKLYPTIIEQLVYEQLDNRCLKLSTVNIKQIPNFFAESIELPDTDSLQIVSKGTMSFNVFNELCSATLNCVFAKTHNGKKQFWFAKVGLTTYTDDDGKICVETDETNINVQISELTPETVNMLLALTNISKKTDIDGKTAFTLRNPEQAVVYDNQLFESMDSLKA